MKEYPILLWLGRAAALATIIAVLVGTFMYLEDLKYSTARLYEQMTDRFDEKQALDDKWLVSDANEYAKILSAILASHSEQMNAQDDSEELLIARMLSTTESVKAQNQIIVVALADLSYRLGQHSCQEGN